jgi:hypothetical protein
MIPTGSRVVALDCDPSGHFLKANVVGLTRPEIEELCHDFQAEYGMTLDLKGQMSLF